MKLGMQGGLGPGHIVLDGDPTFPPQKGDGAPIFAPPQFSALQFSAHVCCGQMARWIKMPLGMDVGLGPSEFVLHGVRAKMALSVEVSLGPGRIVLATLPKKGAEPPNFRPIFIVAKRLDTSRCHSVWGLSLIHI